MFRNEWIFVAVLAITAALPARQAFAQSLTPPQTPANLVVPDGNSPYLKAEAAGTQNYVCLPSVSGLAWTFQGPQATLFLTFRLFNGEVRQQIATHFLSPNPAESGTPARATWQHSLDTSAVWAAKIADSSDPAFVQAGAIPWLLLKAVGTQRGPLGGTALARTTFIQRVNTTGGTVTDTPCTQVGAIRFVPYTAEYVFYETAAGH